jgi:GntR family transcriptional regulator/MocR family aminotransferase
VARLFARGAPEGATLQSRVREAVVHAIVSGMVPPDAPLPPSRTLARMLGVSRNTVSFALDALVERGFLDARPRSGIYVNAAILEAGVAIRRPRRCRRRPALGAPAAADAERAAQRRQAARLGGLALPVRLRPGRCVAAAGRRLARVRAAVAALRAMRAWSRDHIDRDVEPLVDQIQQRLLPARGIWAGRDEILVTAGAQMATYLLSQVLLDRRSAVGVEDPGYPDARNAFALRAARVGALPIDAMGLRIGPTCCAATRLRDAEPPVPDHRDDADRTAPRAARCGRAPRHRADRGRPRERAQLSRRGRCRR